MSTIEQPSADAPGVDSTVEALCTHAGRFDASSMLELLARRFPSHRVLMESQRALGPSAALFAGVELRGNQIVVRVNLGLRSGTTPLPSYFQALFDEPSAGPGLAELVARIDRALLPQRLAAYHLDVGGLLPVATWRLRKRLLELAKRASPSTLHWLFSSVFPELDVRIERRQLARRLPSNEARLGAAVTGVATLGGEASVPVSAFDVILRVADSVTWGDLPWRHEAHRRVHTHVLPALTGTAAYLRVVFIAVDGVERDRLALQNGSYLGFEPMVGLTADENSAVAPVPLSHIVFEGDVDASL